MKDTHCKTSNKKKLVKLSQMSNLSDVKRYLHYVKAEAEFITSFYGH